MKTIIHISDLHFGRVDHTRIDPLLDIVQKVHPDMVVISGDFTQRAKEKEFKDAKEFIKKLNHPVFVIPGNHDIPLYNIFKRFGSPFKRYKEFISEDLAPLYVDDEMALIGINSVRNFTISSGRISKKDIQAIEKNIQHLPKDLIKIVVCHHPFDLPMNANTHHKHTHKVVASSNMAMNTLAKYGVDMFLSGHLHVHHIGDSTFRYKIKDYSALIVQAGTAISKRSRGEPVSFNVIHLDRKTILIEHYKGERKHAGYELHSTEKFNFVQGTWKKAE